MALSAVTGETREHTAALVYMPLVHVVIDRVKHELFYPKETSIDKHAKFYQAISVNALTHLRKECSRNSFKVYRSY